MFSDLATLLGGCPGGACILCWILGDLGGPRLGLGAPTLGPVERDSAFAWAGVREGPRLACWGSRGETAIFVEEIERLSFDTRRWRAG